jgi:hypothetical protein
LQGDFSIAVLRLWDSTNTQPSAQRDIAYHNQECDAMKENPENSTRVKRRSTWKPLATAAAILAVIQACFTIEGMGIEGFILWVIILFIGYLLFFTALVWLWQRFRDRA